jgi:hypothetical protein
MGENDQVNVVLSKLKHDELYYDILYYLKNLSCHDHLIDHKIRALILKAMKYGLTQDGLGLKKHDGLILMFVNKDEADKLINKLHFGYSGGHFSTHTTAHKILIYGYYWPTLFTYTH